MIKKCYAPLGLQVFVGDAHVIIIPAISLFKLWDILIAVPNGR